MIKTSSPPKMSNKVPKYIKMKHSIEPKPKKRRITSETSENLATWRGKEFTRSNTKGMGNER